MNTETDPIVGLDCFVCSQSICEESYPYNDTGWNNYGGIFAKLRIYHCRSCGFGFSAPELDEATVRNFYEKQYRAKNSPFYINFDEASLIGQGISRSDRAFGQLMLAREYCKFNSGDVFLDIGPGGGGGLATAKALLPQPQLFGIELSDGASEYYRKRCGALTYKSIADFSRAVKKAKILLMSHSLEHYRLSELTELFSALRKALANDGILVIEVPYADLRIHSEIRGVDTPHFIFFSKESISRLLEKFGFDVLFMDTCGEQFKTVEEIKLTSKSFASKSRRYLKPIYNRTPRQLQNSLRGLLRVYRLVRSGEKSRQIEADSLDIQAYGGNRNCIRLVARLRRQG